MIPHTEQTARGFNILVSLGAYGMTLEEYSEKTTIAVHVLKEDIAAFRTLARERLTGI